LSEKEPFLATACQQPPAKPPCPPENKERAMPESRRLTDGEIRLARSVFGNHLDYAAVRICRAPKWLTAAVSPNGSIYYPAPHYLDDFSQAGAPYQIWLIHELTHVWQWQHGFQTWLGGLLLWTRGGYLGRRAYHCPALGRIVSFAELNMEQQAEILARHFAVSAGYRPASAEELGQYRRILDAFFHQSGGNRPLPRYFARICPAKSAEN